MYHFNVTLHVLAAILWLGGMFFFALVGAPVLRKVEPAELRSELFRALGTRFRAFGWITIAVLLVTGLLNLQFRGMLSTRVLGSSEFWHTKFGLALGWKLSAVASMLILQAIHDFALGPAASRAEANSDRAIGLRRWAALLARVSALIGLLVIGAAVRLTRS